MAISDFLQQMQRPETRMMLSSYSQALTDPRSGGFGRAAGIGAANYQEQLQQYKQQAIQDKLRGRQLDIYDQRLEAEQKQAEAERQRREQMAKQFEAMKGSDAWKELPPMARNLMTMGYSMDNPSMIGAAGRLMAQTAQRPDMFSPELVKTPEGGYAYEMLSDRGERTVIPTPNTPVVASQIPETRQEIKERETLAGEGIKDLVSRRPDAQRARDSLIRSEVAENLIGSEIVTGFGADFIVGFGKALQQIGINVDDDPIANSEAFVAAQATEVANIIQQFGAGTGLSDADREFALNAAAGKITTNKEAIRRIIEINREASRNVIRNYNKDASQIEREKMPFDLTIEMPDVGGKKAGSRKEENQGNGDVVDWGDL